MTFLKSNESGAVIPLNPANVDFGVMGVGEAGAMVCAEVEVGSVGFWVNAGVKPEAERGSVGNELVAGWQALAMSTTKMSPITKRFIFNPIQ